MSNSGLLCTDEQNSLNLNTELKRKLLKKYLLRTCWGIISLWIIHFNHVDDVISQYPQRHVIFYKRKMRYETGLSTVGIHN